MDTHARRALPRSRASMECLLGTHGGYPRHELVHLDLKPSAVFVDDNARKQNTAATYFGCVVRAKTRAITLMQRTRAHATQARTSAHARTNRTRAHVRSHDTVPTGQADDQARLHRLPRGRLGV